LSQYGVGNGTIPYAFIAQYCTEAWALAEPLEGGPEQGGNGTTPSYDFSSQVSRIQDDLQEMLRRVTSLAASAARAAAAPGVGAGGGSSVISASGKITIETKDGTRLTIG
jgi:hypothetical protein